MTLASMKASQTQEYILLCYLKLKNQQSWVMEIEVRLVIRIDREGEGWRWGLLIGKGRKEPYRWPEIFDILFWMVVT